MPRLTCLAVLCSLALTLSLSTPSLAQTNPVAGIQPFSVYGGGQYDAIDAASGNIVLQIPVMSKTGKIPFSHQVLGNSRAYVYNCGSGCALWKVSGGLLGGVKAFATLSYTTTRQQCGVSGVQWQDSNFVVTDSTGAVHQFSGTALAEYGDCQVSATGGITNDHTGYALTAQSNGTNPPTYTLYDRSGDVVTSASVTDPDGVAISSTSQVVGSGQTLARVTSYTDTLGQTVLTSTVFVNRSGPNATSSPDTYVYNDVNGNPLDQVTVNYTQYTQQTNFACGGSLVEVGPSAGYFPTSVVLADGETIGLSYEGTPFVTGNYTGRIAKIMLPTGGYVKYDYSGGPNGINCSTGKSTITRTVNDGNGNNSAWTYTPSALVDSWGNFYTTINDPAGNTIVDHFNYEALTQEVVTDKNLGLLSTRTICRDYYYSSQATCVQPNPRTYYSVKTGVVDIYTSFGTAPASLTEIQYDLDPGIVLPYGNVATVKRWATGAATYPPSGTPLSTTTTTYANISGVTCGSVPAETHDRPCSSTTTNAAGSTLSNVKYTYTNGHPTETQTLVSGTTYLNSFATYNPNGTIATSTDVNNAVTHYYYNGTGGCNNLLLTSTVLPVDSLTTSKQWNCFGAVLKSTTDFNGNVTSYGYLDPQGNPDPLWRPRSVTDPLLNVTWTTYSAAGTLPVTVEKSMSFNSGASAVDQLNTFDGLGRPILQQTKQSPTSSSYDTVSMAYDTNGRLASKGMPCVSTAPSVGCTSSATATTFDAINRPLQVTDGGGGTTSYVYTTGSTSLDVLVTLGPAPSSLENTKKRQLEYDGLGRLTSVCELTSTANGGGTCAQNTSSPTGFWTTYTYDGLDRLTNVSQNAQSSHPQARNFSYDDLSRMTSELNPEIGTTATMYTYDSYSPGACGWTSEPGDLILKTNPDGSKVCYHHDQIHRVTDMNTSTGNVCRRFRYDLATNAVQAQPTGYQTLNANLLGQMVEAETDSCNTSMVTDEWFRYTPRAEESDLFESTLNSGGYYHTTASYWANGALNTLGGVPGLNTWTFIPDGEGRPYSATSGTSTQVVKSATYYPSNSETTVSYASGTSDKDVFGYDATTGRMNSFKFTVGSAQTTLTGTLGWNSNGTLGTLGVVDQFNTANSKNCAYTYDDLARLAGKNASNFSIDCGSGGWQQAITLDPFGNISKSGSSSFAATYLISNGTTNNQEQTVSSCTPTYDGRGNLTKDCTFSTPATYAWDVYGNPTSLNGVSLTYDALDSEVQIGTTVEVLYTPVGKIGLMNGQSAKTIRIPLPGGGAAELLGPTGGSTHILHSDWLGNARLSTLFGNRTMTYDAAYAPYGENYNGTGSSAFDLDFTGQFQDTTSGLYDFSARYYNPVQGRWVSPDPVGVVAADPSNPQAWNRYAYVLNNPLALIDPAGLDFADCNGLAPDLQGIQPCELYQAAESYLYWYTNGQNAGSSSSFDFRFSLGLSACNSDFMPCGLPGGLGPCVSSFGNPCIGPAGPEGFIYAGLPPNPQLTAWLKPTFDLFNRMYPDPGPPRLARPKKKVDCNNQRCFRNADIGTVRAITSWWDALVTCDHFLPLIMNGQPPNISLFPEGQMGNQNSRNYQEYNPAGHAQGSAAANGAAIMGGWSGCTGGGLNR